MSSGGQNDADKDRISYIIWSLMLATTGPGAPKDRYTYLRTFRREILKVFGVRDSMLF